MNVEGTRNLLEECLRAEVGRVVMTSSVAAIGHAPDGGAADESQVWQSGDIDIAYVSSKHEQEVEALRIAARGLPVVCVNPSIVFGPGDIHCTSTTIVRRFLLGRIPAYVDSGLNIVDVADVASGHLLADEKGVPGERYILAGRNYTFGRLFADLSRISGVEPPALRIPASIAVRVAELAERAPGRPMITVDEARSLSLWWTYRNNKAKRELGWKPTPHEDTLESTVKWYLEREGDRIARARRSQPYPYKAAASALGMAERVGRTASRLVGRGITSGRMARSDHSSAAPPPAPSGSGRSRWRPTVAGTSSPSKEGAVPPAGPGPGRARALGRAVAEPRKAEALARACFPGRCRTAGRGAARRPRGSPLRRRACRRRRAGPARPDSYISRTMSQPPTSSPLTNSWGEVGQPDTFTSSSLMRGSGRMSSAA